MKPVFMKRWLVPTLVAVAILALGVLSAVSSRDSSDDTDNAAAHSRKHDGDKRDKGHKDERAHENENGDRGHGPPPWAHGPGTKLDKSARDEWKGLTPQERRTLIDKLIRERVAGMRAWRDCVVAERDDCVMPFPPGLAKRH